MKKLFFLLFASALFSITACKSGGGEGEKMDSTEMKNMVNEAMDSVKEMMSTPIDTSAKM